MNPSELIDLILDRAPKLRAAGIRTLQLLPDSVYVTIDAVEPVVATPIGFDELPPEPEDPLEDPATFGSDHVPGFEPPRDDADE